MLLIGLQPDNFLIRPNTRSFFATSWILGINLIKFHLDIVRLFCFIFLVKLLDILQYPLSLPPEYLVSGIALLSLPLSDPDSSGFLSGYLFLFNRWMEVEGHGAKNRSNFFSITFEVLTHENVIVVFLYDLISITFWQLIWFMRCQQPDAGNVSSDASKYVLFIFLLAQQFFCGHILLCWKCIINFFYEWIIPGMNCYEQWTWDSQRSEKS